jgi:hypothetical protein
MDILLRCLYEGIMKVLRDSWNVRSLSLVFFHVFDVFHAFWCVVQCTAICFFFLRFFILVFNVCMCVCDEFLFILLFHFFFVHWS